MYIELHQSLPRHPKLVRLASRLGVPRVQAAGHLTFLWLWCVDYAPKGDVSKFGAPEIAAGAEWDGDPGSFVAALLETGWLDEDGKVHDWEEYGGKIRASREADAERKRVSRELKRLESENRRKALSAGTPPDVAQTTPGNASDLDGGPHPGTSAGRLPDVHGMSAVEKSREEKSRGENIKTGTDHAGEEAQGPVVPSGSIAQVNPTMEEAKAFADRNGHPAECAEKWFLDCDARGWVDRAGQPIVRWHSSLLSYAVQWRANAQRDSQRVKSGAVTPPRASSVDWSDPKTAAL